MKFKVYLQSTKEMVSQQRYKETKIWILWKWKKDLNFFFHFWAIANLQNAQMQLVQFLKTLTFHTD